MQCISVMPNGLLLLLYLLRWQVSVCMGCSFGMMYDHWCSWLLQPLGLPSESFIVEIDVVDKWVGRSRDIHSTSCIRSLQIKQWSKCDGENERSCGQVHPRSSSRVHRGSLIYQDNRVVVMLCDSRGIEAKRYHFAIELHTRERYFSYTLHHQYKNTNGQSISNSGFRMYVSFAQATIIFMSDHFHERSIKWIA